jgi:signal transduction histidine kinase
MRQENEIYLQVEDHGLGISPEDQARIFDQFERLVTGRSTSGFGLGLWVVGQLVVPMGGTITVESEPGEGSTLTVLLPLHTTTGSQRPIRPPQRTPASCRRCRAA